ncbi:hypothetical protein I5G60_gp57 [Mycobacterium phage Saguaro]|uniref:DUF6378 domain-containing protein n=1 Tax=Mycobacterium phage Saguaro TaxID=2315616 RepID=A0A386K9I1_9CAUD|nr:hypothetical protein I5G60_gp57 [Mycobacterium phage Saguaro]AYD82051.1 hypothetical protein SEA_SAGUARO_57 [Mycobacterium phage Saguaro]
MSDPQLPLGSAPGDCTCPDMASLDANCPAHAPKVKSMYPEPPSLAERAAEGWTPDDGPTQLYADMPPITTAAERPADSRARREHIVNTALSLINGDRQDTYGDARTDFIRTGRMWAAVLGLPEVRPEQVALCMALVKVGRLCNSPAHLDSWIDAVGYLALGGDIATTA